MPGVRAIHFDFFSSPDTFLSHRNVADLFSATRQRMDYTECHFGMAAYGPKFQREVLINHPDDIGDFDISGFSVDLTTLMAFRMSRARWQTHYHNLIPEYGLYYFITHYANMGHPRRTVDPEPQQFLYNVHAYTGIGFSFHEVFGFLSTLMAAAAFSLFHIFGHLDPNMPRPDA